MTLPIAALDVDLHELLKQVAARKFQARMDRLDDLRAHPEYATAGTPAPAGELAEVRHLLYDADPDASTPAFPYPSTEAAS